MCVCHFLLVNNTDIRCISYNLESYREIFVKFLLSSGGYVERTISVMSENIAINYIFSKLDSRDKFLSQRYRISL